MNSFKYATKETARQFLAIVLLPLQLVAFPFVYTYNFVLTPAHMDAEKQTHIDSLEQFIRDKGLWDDFSRPIA